jgi:hypothetical protein
VFDKVGYSFLWPGSRSTIVRTSTSQEVHSALVSAAWLGALGAHPVTAADGNAVVTDVRPMEALVSTSTSLLRFRALLLAAFSVLALFLAAAGIYAVISYIVKQRTSEIGTRMALRARTVDIFIMVLGRGAVLAALGSRSA